MRSPVAALLLFLVASTRADERKPVPLLQVLPLPNAEASIQRDGLELTRYHFGADLDRPFFYPLRHPATGRSLTRMGHPHDPESHSHHNSVWISHHKVDGLSFWLDRDKEATGTIRHARINEYIDGDDAATIDSLNHWICLADGRIVLIEHRQSTASLVPEALGGGWLLVLDLQFSVPGDAPVTFEADPFGLIGVRMAKTIGVHDGGGRILNSEGAVNEEAVFRKPARWVDYSGRVTNASTGGITLFDHPENPGYPSPFHVRNDGWMGICLSLNTPVVVQPGMPLQLRYGLWMHDGIPEKSAIEPVAVRIFQSP
jgi:hypothetical protein